MIPQQGETPLPPFKVTWTYFPPLWFPNGVWGTPLPPTIRGHSKHTWALKCNAPPAPIHVHKLFPPHPQQQHDEQQLGAFVDLGPLTARKKGQCKSYSKCLCSAVFMWPTVHKISMFFALIFRGWARPHIYVVYSTQSFPKWEEHDLACLAHTHTHTFFIVFFPRTRHQRARLHVGCGSPAGPRNRHLLLEKSKQVTISISDSQCLRPKNTSILW